jgi:hypothetical protein
MGECKQDACTTLWGLSESEVLVGLWGVCKPAACTTGDGCGEGNGGGRGNLDVVLLGRGIVL